MTGGRFDPLGATNVKPFGRLEVFPPDVTVTSAMPAVVRAPVTAVIDEGPVTTTPVAGTPPIVTVESAAKPLPLIVSVFPPVVLPVEGDTVETLSVVEVGADGESDPHATRTSGTSAVASAASERSSVRPAVSKWRKVAGRQRFIGMREPWYPGFVSKN